MFARSIFLVAPTALCLVSALEVVAQSSLSVPWPAAKKAPPDEISVRDNFPAVSRSSVPQGLSRGDRKRLEPDKEDLERFHRLLKQNGYGIAKILNVSCGSDGVFVINVNGCADTIPGHGASFSFRAREHSLPEFSDIRISGGRFVCGGAMIQGLIVALGETEPGTVDDGREEVRILENFSAAASLAGAQKQTVLINRGFWNDGHLYSASREIKENQTYALRSIAYRTRQTVTDKRRDITVVFQIVRFDNEGNVTIIWRELQNKESPRLDLER